MLALSFLFYMYLFNSPHPSLFLLWDPSRTSRKRQLLLGSDQREGMKSQGKLLLGLQVQWTFCFEKENLSNKLTFLPSYRQCMKIKVQDKSRGLSHSFPHLPLTRCLPESVAVGAAVGAHQLCGAHPDIWKTLSGRGIKQQASANYNSCL